MIRITQLKLRPGQDPGMLEDLIRKTLRIGRSEPFTHEVLRHSIDARKKPDLFEVYTVLVRFQNPETEKKILHARIRNVDSYEQASYRYSDNGRNHADSGIEADSLSRPVIIGTGPAGLFCGLLLAREGLRPILIERGQRAKIRSKSVESFWQSGIQDEESNVQFGEGGAGTFSDGKLNTGVKDPEGRIRFVLETFVQHGADPDILSSASPHIGTDVLKNVVTSLTDEICFRGGEVYFETRMDRIFCDENSIWQVSCSRQRTGCGPDGSREKILFSGRYLVLAIGHSSRDTFAMLHDSGIVMNPKAFAVGVRIQHPQSVIDRAMYGENCRFDLPAASYKLTHRLMSGRGVYSFCMCPGGYIVNASSERGCLAVNGMSFHGRASGSANSAIVVTVSPEDLMEYAGMDPKQPVPSLIGVQFQRQLESAAYQAGKGAVPVQRFGDFAGSLSSCSVVRLPDHEPLIKGAWKAAPVRQIFPPAISAGIEEGILAWERRIEGFSSPDSLLCAAESRTSSPVRIERDHSLQALNHPGLFPCGEGAGYAGGITSAAIDGLKVAEQILRL